MKIHVDSGGGYNGIKQIHPTRDVITFVIIQDRFQFTSFEIKDTKGTNKIQQPQQPGPFTQISSLGARTVSFDYSGDPIPPDGFLFTYVTARARPNGKSSGKLGRKDGPPFTAGDGSGVIKNH